MVIFSPKFRSTIRCPCTEETGFAVGKHRFLYKLLLSPRVSRYRFAGMNNKSWAVASDDVEVDVLNFLQ